MQLQELFYGFAAICRVAKHNFSGKLLKSWIEA